MKRFAALVLTLVLCLGLFSACGSEANYNVADVAGAIEGVATIDNPTDFTDDDLTLDMSLDMEATVEEYAGQRTKTNGAPGAVLVVKAKAGQADTVKAALEGYRDGLVAQWENYKDEFPVGYEQTKKWPRGGKGRLCGACHCRGRRGLCRDRYRHQRCAEIIL